MLEIADVVLSSASSKFNNDRPGGRTLDASGFNADNNFHTRLLNGYNWETSPTDTAPTITYDLNERYDLGSVRLWNLNNNATVRARSEDDRGLYVDR